VNETLKGGTRGSTADRSHFRRAVAEFDPDIAVLNLMPVPDVVWPALPSASCSTPRPRHAGQEGNMEDIERISVEEAHKKAKANQALLVCAYEDEAKCRVLNLDGSISLASFLSKAASLPKSQEIIFFCA
jgi:hypothetical protein